jgi:hypothetical protein
MPLCPQVTNTPVTISFDASYSNTTLIAGDVPATVEELENVEVQVIGKNHIYRQASPPDGSVYPLVEGDCWFDTDDGNKQYYWTGSAWVSVQDLAIQAAATAAAAAAAGAAAAQSAAAAADAAAVAAQTTANGKNKIYRQTTMPTTGPFAEGDLWFDTDDDNKFYRYTSGAFSAFTLGDGALASLSANKLTAGTIDASVITVSNLDAGRITTGYLAAARIEVNSLSGDKITGRTIEAAKLAVGTISATEIGAGAITAVKIEARTITADRIALFAITADEIAGGTITAAEIAANTITADEIEAGSITVDRLAVGTLTGFTIQTSGSNRIRMQDSTNSINFIVGGTQRAHLVPAGTNGVIMHYGTAPNSNATSYPLVFVSSGSVVVAYSSTKFLEVNSLGCVANGDLYSPANFYNQDTTTTTNAANTWMSSTTGLTRRSTASSLRYKENIVDIRTVPELDPKKLLDVPVRAFKYKANYLDTNDDRSGSLLPGFIAEEVAETYPVAADLVEGQVESWNDRYVVPALLALVQDLESRIKILENK